MDVGCWEVEGLECDPEADDEVQLMLEYVQVLVNVYEDPSPKNPR